MDFKDQMIWAEEQGLCSADEAYEYVREGMADAADRARDQQEPERRGLDASYVLHDGREVYYSEVHKSWALRWEVGGEPYSKNLTVGQAVNLVGPWWCPSCSRAHVSTLSTNHGEPACPKCGTILEPQGEGDDDPGD